jgi:hypothetical protein
MFTLSIWSSVVKVIGYGVDDQAEILGRCKEITTSEAFRPALWPIQPSLKWVDLSPGGKAARARTWPFTAT